MKQESVFEPEEHPLYQSNIRFCIYNITYPRSELIYHVSNLSQFLAAPSKSHLMAAKGLLPYMKSTNDLNMSFPRSDASEITHYRYFDAAY
jgi:hypothetical protein